MIDRDHRSDDDRVRARCGKTAKVTRYRVGILSAWARRHDNNMFVRVYVCMRRSRIAGANTAGTGYNVNIRIMYEDDTTPSTPPACGRATAIVSRVAFAGWTATPPSSDDNIIITSNP
uniref:Uncharacterized protein n=1 Tax=Schizaphis graminum TaxID=13262 RepID=A0A2S2PKG8_SCHGA